MVCIELNILVNLSILNNIGACQDHPSDKRWKKGTHDMLYKNSYFFVITGQNRTGSSLTGIEKWL